MIDPDDFLDSCEELGIAFFTGVPDSLIKSFIQAIHRRHPIGSGRHVAATNEGTAIALAIGRYTGTRRLPMVYMQNAGLGNALNPIVSLADPLVLGIPIVLMIGWRAEVDADSDEVMVDEPQHRRQGQITLSQLYASEIPHQVLSIEHWMEQLKRATHEALEGQRPVALVVRKDTFSPLEPTDARPAKALMTREEAIARLAAAAGDMPIVCTTGMASRELYEVRRRSSLGAPSSPSRDLFIVGGMGHASGISAGIASSNPDEKLLCIDGDGALLMHTGVLAITAKTPNLIHAVLCNEVHDSVGGQPIADHPVDILAIARAFGYTYAARADTPSQVDGEMFNALNRRGSTFLEIPCRPGSRPDLGRPSEAPRTNWEAFASSLAGRRDPHRAQ